MGNEWPAWWHWELDISSHLVKRMTERRFSETDLRLMLQEARSISPDIEPGRWAVEVRHERQVWEVIVEPDEALHLIVVITAYPVY